VATRICFALIWLAFSLYAFLLAPPPSPDTVRLIVQLSTGQWSDINPLVIALFNLMGVWPLIYCCLLFADGRGQKIPPGPSPRCRLWWAPSACCPTWSYVIPSQPSQGRWIEP
jgi:hypothetical protein